ncbi:MAG: glutamate--tRNA ligase family protein, partial [Rubripirellula sp.]
IASTFRQIELYRALDLPVPRFAHVPLVCGADGRRLAKRHGDTRMSHYQDQGVSSSQVVTWAARSAGMLADNEQAESAHAMIERFDWARLPSGDVILDDFPA